MERTTGFSRTPQFFFAAFALSLLCWGRLLFLRGIWWDDWAWTWHYFSSGSLSEFLAPFRSLRHMLDGFLFFLNFKLFEIVPLQALTIWNIFKFIMYVCNAALLYSILRRVLPRGSLLPALVSVFYLTSPVVNNICLVESGRRLYLCLFLLSILLSVKSIERGFNILYYAGAVVCGSIAMYGIESLAFFEAARPVVLMSFFLIQKKMARAKAIKISLLHWLAFVLIGGFIVLYNSGVLNARTGVYADAYQFESLKNIAVLASNYIRSIYYVFAGDLNYFIRARTQRGPDLLALVLAFVSAIAVVYAIAKNLGKESEKGKYISESGSVAVTSIFLLLFGLIPYVISRGYPAFGPDSRHALICALCVALIVPSALLWLYYKGAMMKPVFCFIIGSMIFMNVYQCNSMVIAYDDDWRQQVMFWEKFTEQVPNLKENTYLVVDMSRYRSDYFGSWKGSYEFAAPLNILYARTIGKEGVNRYFAESVENASNIDVPWSYANNKDKTVGEFVSFKGNQKYYPKNLLTARFRGGVLKLEDPSGLVIHAGVRGGEAVVERRYPLRWIIK